MARQLLQLLLVIVMALGVLSYLGFSAILSDIEQNQRANQKQLLADISTQINLAYELLDKLLSQKKQGYREIHQLARSLILEANHQPDLPMLQKIVEQEAGFPVDLYIIDADLTIADTTFTPDMGLDFKLPPFLDVQQFLGKARLTDQIMVGQPNMEFTRKKFKIYTYSVLGDDRYLELGLIDPDIDGYFQRLIRHLADRADARVALFYELWDEILVPMTQAPENDSARKLALFKQNEADTRQDQQAFHQAITSSRPYQTHTADDQGRKITSYYIKVPGLSESIVDQLKVHFLAKITFDDYNVSVIKGRFRLFLLLSVLLAITGMLYLAFHIRRQLIEPLDQIVAAIERKKRVNLPSLPGGSHEIRKIAATYNDTLEHLKQNMVELERLSTLDPLTGLDNRRKFTHSFDREISRAKRRPSTLALAMIDIDHFKAYNDRNGHQQGDQLLIGLARHMKNRFLRPSDHLCRMGGDEFSVLLIDIDPSTIASVFEGLRREWMRQYDGKTLQTAGADTLPLSISIGIYVFDSSLSPTWENAYQQADRALYTAKSKGRNQVAVVEDAPKPGVSLPLE